MKALQSEVLLVAQQRSDPASEHLIQGTVDTTARLHPMERAVVL